MKRYAAILVLTLLAACAGGQLNPAQTFTERVAYVEASAQGAIKTLADLTCTKYTNAGVCAEAGRPLHPERSKGYLDALSKVRLATRASASTNAVVQCLGQPSTPIACLSLATDMLSEVQRTIDAVKRN